MSASTEPAWLPRLRDASRPNPSAASAGLEVIRGARPRLFDADAARALSSCLLAAFVVAAAVFRERVMPVPFDLIAMLLRTASAAFVVRAALAIVALLRRLRRDSRAAEHVLAWGPEGLLLSAAGAEHWVAKEDVLGLALPEHPERSAAPQPERPLVLVVKPQAGIRLLEIPPYFAANQTVLAARLRRWLDRELGPPAERFDGSQGSPEERYVRIAQGRLEAGELSVPEGFGYRLRAPYGTLLGCLFAADAVHAAGPMGMQLLPGALAASMLALSFLAGWLLWMRRRSQSRLGIAMALTREELLMRGKAGTVSLPWAQLAQIEVDLKLVWSPFFGSYPVRILALVTTDGERLVFDGGFLGVPAEAVSVLCECYRRRWV